jgi:RimJ/RimL family protein N-acetyltransferase
MSGMEFQLSMHAYGHGGKATRSRWFAKQTIGRFGSIYVTPFLILTPRQMHGNSSRRRSRTPESSSSLSKLDSEAVGSIGLLLQPDLLRQSAEIGYWLGESHCRGCMTEAVRAVTAYGLQNWQ